MSIDTAPFVPPATAADALDAAALIIALEGHGKGSYHEPTTGCYCALGALGYATTRAHNFDAQMDDAPADRSFEEFTPAQFDVFEEARYALAHYLVVNGRAEARTDAFFTVSSWNDEQGRTSDDVVQAMRAAAETLR